MILRFAQETDIPQMLKLLLQVAGVHHEIRPDMFKGGARKYDEAALKAMLADPLRPVLAAEIDGLMAGYCMCILQIAKDDPLLCDRKVLYIDDLCVDESVRGTGVAKALYEHTVQYARSIGCNAITLNVWTGNDRAQRFYEKCGLKPQKIGLEYIL